MCLSQAIKQGFNLKTCLCIELLPHTISPAYKQPKLLLLFQYFVTIQKELGKIIYNVIRSTNLKLNQSPAV